MSAPLTIEQARVLAAQWVDHERNEWDKALDAYETDALRGWLTRRMAEYVEACTKAGIGPWDASEVGHMDDMASWMALDLFDDDDADGQSKARALCEWAGWPS